MSDVRCRGWVGCEIGGQRVEDTVPEYEPWQPNLRRAASAEEVNGYRVEPYGNSRYWQVVDPAGDLVCVAVYKRGAREVVRRLAA
jgi:hypothetical protein